MNEDLLEASISILKSKMESVMCDINFLMSSNSYQDDLPKKLASKISKLRKATQDYQQALGLKAQIMAMKISGLEQKNEDKDEQKK